MFLSRFGMVLLRYSAIRILISIRIFLALARRATLFRFIVFVLSFDSRCFALLLVSLFLFFLKRVIALGFRRIALPLGCGGHCGVVTLQQW